MTREDTVTLTSKQYHDLVTALEQEKGAYNALAKDCIPMSVIEDIKAEIKAEKIKEKRYDNDNHIFIHKDICIGLQEALDIIDKNLKGERMTNKEAIDILKHDISADKQGIVYCHDALGIDALDMAIKALEQEPKTGHWEYVQYDYNPRLGNWHCSECRCVVIECVDKNEKGGIPLYKYCPQCGAKMEGQDE